MKSSWQRIKGLLKLAGINLAVLSVLLILLELFFGAWIFSANHLTNLGILHNVELRFEQSLYDDPPSEVIYTRDNYGFRGMHTFNHPEKIDILTLGGSTTDQRYITDSLTWQAHLERQLQQHGKPYLVANAGVDGQSTFGHIKCFELWFPQVEKLHPQYVLFYVGLNDFFKVQDRSDYDKVGIDELGFFKRLKASIKNNSVLYHTFRKMHGIYLAKKAKIGHHQIDLKAYPFTATGVAPPELFAFYQKENIPHFRQRIQTLIERTTQMGAEPVFITQPAARYRWVNGQVHGVDEVNYLKGMPFNGVDYYHLLTMINQAMVEACDGKYLVIDLTSAPVWEPADFYDWYHMTPKGAEKVGKEIYNGWEARLD